MYMLYIFKCACSFILTTGSVSGKTLPNTLLKCSVCHDYISLFQQSSDLFK